MEQIPVFALIVIPFIIVNTLSLKVEDTEQPIFCAVAETKAEWKFLNDLKLKYKDEHQLDVVNTSKLAESDSVLQNESRKVLSSLSKLLSGKTRGKETTNTESTRNERSLSSQSFIPIELIPGTELYTGIYYRIGIKRFPAGWLTWTVTKNNLRKWHYIQIDANPSSQPNYEKDGSWYVDAHWVFIKSNVEGHYTLKNRKFPNAVATWSPEEKYGSNGFKIVLDPSPNSGVNPRGNSLWRPFRPETEGDDSPYYKLSSQSVPHAIVTWTAQKDGENAYYMQVDANENATQMTKYLPGDEWWDDTLFRFEPIEKEFLGEIKLIELQLFSKLDEMKSLTVTDCENVPATIFVNNEGTSLVRQVNQDLVGKGELNIKLNANIPIGLKLTGSGYISPPWYANLVEFNIENGGQTFENMLRLSTTEKNRVNTNVYIPPWTTTEIRVCSEFIDNAENEVDAAVFVDISEKTFRPDSKSFEATYTSMPITSVMQQVNQMVNTPEVALDERWGIQRNVQNRNVTEESSSPSAAAILGNTETKVVVVLPGKVTGRFGYRGVIASN